MKLKVVIKNKRDIRFYSPDTNWTSFVAVVKEVIEGSDDNFVNIMVSSSSSIKAAGVVSFEPKTQSVYILMGDYIKDEKWGWQFKIDGGYEEVSLDNKSDQRLFLEQILTERQVNSLYDTFENPFEYIENKDVSKLMEAKFIGEHTANRIINKFNSAMDMAPAYNFFKPLGVTPLLINKLCETYQGAENAVNKFKENPYILADEVKGVGFIKADEIALKYNVKKEDPFRIKAGVRYLFQNIANNEGSTWLEPEDFKSQISELLRIPYENIHPVILDMIEHKNIYYEPDSKIALMYYYDLEKNIARKLLELQHAPVTNYSEEDILKGIRRAEKEQGFEFTDEQVEGIKSVFKSNVSLIVGYAGCVDCDTEYFNGRKWVPISEYNGTDKVLQYNDDGTANLVIPNDYIVNPQKKLNYMHTKYGIDMCISDNHTFVHKSPKGVLYKEPFSDIKPRINNVSFRGRVITTFDYSGYGIDLTDDEIRFYIAVFADGSFAKFKSDKGICRFHIKKDRKKERLIKLLEALKINYKTHKSSADGYLDIYVYDVIKNKHFPQEWYQCSKHQLEVIADEVMFWDGNYKDNNCFSTNCKKDADFIQFVYTSLGKRATISTLDRRGRMKKDGYLYKSIEYSVSWTDRIYCSLCQDKRENHTPTKVEEYYTKDGLEYCFNVPSHMLVLRRNNRIFITGNCGKTSVIKGAYQVFPFDTVIKQCAFSGQAAKRINETTNRPSSTIHRLLGWQGETFVYSETLPLPTDVVIIDEISMVGLELFWRLLQAIPNGAKLIMLGDNGQLPPIGVGNLLSDLLSSSHINIVKLTKIHRQAEKSAIITSSQKVRNKQWLFPISFNEDKTYGELRDLTLKARSETGELFDILIDTFMSEYHKIKNIKDIQIIVAQNQRVVFAREQINKIIQEKINPKMYLSQPEVKVAYNNVLRIGDKVINRVNHYDVENPDGIQSSVYNGSMGIVKEISTNYIIIDFFDEGEIVIPREYYQGIELAYAITCHASQGSQFKTVIVAFDNSSYILLSNEWLYTAITRARNMCYIIAQTKSINMAVTRNKTINRNTFLTELIENTK